MTTPSKPSFFIGCAIWAKKEWIGNLYPPGSRPTDLFRLYTRRFTTVEGNTTFYVVPDRDMIARWAAESPPGFELCPKLHRDITHAGPLAPEIPAALRFVEEMRGLGSRLGPIFAQVPPTYGPDNLRDLEQFLAAWPHDAARLALEVRHSDWFYEPHASRLNALLERRGTGRVLLDTRPIYEGPPHPALPQEHKKPQRPVQPVLTAPFTLIRYISHPQAEANRPYLEAWVDPLTSWLRRGTSVYFFVHCPDDVYTPENIRYSQRLFEERGVPVPPLPWSGVGAQLRLL
jgi:uncharacterized protein YecE (DUF72 family)